MPSFSLLVQSDVWPIPNGRLHSLANIHAAEHVMPLGQEGIVATWQMQDDEVINTALGENMVAQLPPESFAIYSDSSGRFRFAIAEESATEWFITQPVRLEKQGMPILLLFSYENGVFNANINSQPLLLEEDADGQLCVAKSLFEPNMFYRIRVSNNSNVYTLGKTFASLAIYKRQSSRS